MKSSQFNKDINDEKWFSSILDKVFYPDFIAKLNRELKGNHYSFERTSDSENQFRGIDLIITNNNTSQEHLIDEKAQLHYLNKTLPTFVFELHYLKEKRSKIGWFLDSNKKTTHYFFFRHIFVSKNRHVESFRMDSINIISLKNYLSRFGLTDEFLLEIIDKLNHSINFEDELYVTPYKENSYSFRILPIFLNKLITLKISPNYPEKPMNLLINLDKLIKVEPGLFKQYNYPFPS